MLQIYELTNRGQVRECTDRGGSAWVCRTSINNAYYVSAINNLFSSPVEGSNYRDICFCSRFHWHSHKFPEITAAELTAGVFHAVVAWQRCVSLHTIYLPFVISHYALGNGTTTITFDLDRVIFSSCQYCEGSFSQLVLQFVVCWYILRICDMNMNVHAYVMPASMPAQ